MKRFHLTRNRSLGAVAAVWLAVVASIFAFAREHPCDGRSTEPVAITHWASGHLLREGDGVRLLPVMADEFNRAGHTTCSGRRIVVEVRDVPSERQAEYLVVRAKGGKPVSLQPQQGMEAAPTISDPTIVTPSDDHWLVSANHEVGRPLVDFHSAPTIVRPYIGIVTYEQMARCLGWPEKEIGYADIIALRADPRGWASYDCASTAWGQRPLLAFTNPTTSSTGRSVLFALYSFGAGKPPEQLTMEDVNRPNVVSYVKGFQGLIDHYLIGTTVLNTKIYQGPRYGHFFIMPEDNLIHLYEGTERAYVNGRLVRADPITEPMVMIYPKEGSMPRNNCACIVQADWVSGEQAEAAEKWIAFLLEDTQQRSFMAAGFRPGTDIPLTDPESKISAMYGLDPEEPRAVLSPALVDPAVAAAIDASWEEVKRPAIVTFVVDTSVSMMGTKLEQASKGLTRALDTMAKKNQIGLVTFGDAIKTQIPIVPWTERHQVSEAVQNSRVEGEGALFDAIKAGIEMTDTAPGAADAIRAVVVLTDGRANKGEIKLHNLIRMVSRNKVPIRACAGFSCSVATDETGATVAVEDIVGVGLAMITRYPVQVFWIGIGDDAEIQIGRLLAQATGAEFEATTEDALANLLEEFGIYF